MSTDKQPTIDDAEWQAQQRAMRAGYVSGHGDAGATSYRRVADALATHPSSEPPGDFAAGVIAHVARRQARGERAVTRIMLLTVAVAIFVTSVEYGEAWWTALNALPGHGARGWVIAGLACVAVSWIPRWLPSRTQETH